MTLEQAWATIERVVETTDGPRERFRAGAEQRDIARAVEKLGVTFPERFVQSYLRHDGQEDGVESIEPPAKVSPQKETEEKEEKEEKEKREEELDCYHWKTKEEENCMIPAQFL